MHKRTFDQIFRTLIALPIGWALFGIVSTIVYGVHFSVVSQMVSLVLFAVTTLALFLANITQRSLSKDSVLLGLAGLLFLTAICFVVDLSRILTMTPDSSYLARFGQNIGLGNYEGSRLIFSMWGPLVPLMHSITNLLGQKLYWQYQPVLSFNLVAIVFYTVFNIMRKRKSASQSAVAATALVSLMALSNMFVFNVFYIHTNILSALYLYLLVFALAKIPHYPGIAYELLAFLSLIAFSLIRLEAPVFAVVVLLFASFRQDCSYVSRLKLIIPFVVLIAVWYARVYFLLPERPDDLSLLTPPLAIVMIVALVGFGLFAALSHLKMLDPIVSRTPSVTLGALALASIVLTLVKPGHMLTSLEGIVRNVLQGGEWGLTWYVVLAAITVLYFIRESADERHWLCGVLIAYVLLVYNLAYASDPYRIGRHDSANRLMLQALPLVILYLSHSLFARIKSEKTAVEP